MLVSGGKIIAIDGVNTTSATLSGDGVFTPLGVNTDNVATKKFVTDNLNNVSSKLTDTDNDLSAAIDYVSANAGNTYTQGDGIVINDENKISISSKYIEAITNVSSVSSDVKTLKQASASWNEVSSKVNKPTQEQTGKLVYNADTSSWVALPEGAATIVEGKNGISAKYDVQNSTYTVGLSGDYKAAIENVSSKLDKSFSSNFYPMTGNPSGFLTAVDLTPYQKIEDMTAYQLKGNYYSASNPSGFITKSSADGLYQPLGNYLSANALKDLSGNWQDTYSAVTNNSGNWNSAYDLAKVLSGLKEIKTFSSVNLKRDSGNDITITARNSADYFRFVANGNIYMESNNNDILISAKDTTYSGGDFVDITEDHIINVSGVQPSGDYVSSTTFTAYQKEVADEFTQTSSWVSSNFLSSNALEYIGGYSANWEEAANVVNTASGKWDSVYNTVNTASGNWETLTTIKTFSSIGGIPADSSASKLEFISGDNIDIKVVDKKIYISSHDTTYDENDFISAIHFNNITSVSSTVKTNSAAWSSAASALEASAANWNKTYEEFTESSTIWNDTAEAVQTNSANWDSVYNTVDEYSATWNSVTSVSSDLEELSGKVEDVSADVEDISGYIEYISGAVNNKLDTTAFNTWSANADITPYSAGEGLALNDHQFYVSGKYLTSASDSLAGKMLVLKDNEWMEMPEFGGFTTAAPTGADSHPDVANPSTKLIYLVKDSTVTGNDKYAEWIYTSADAQTTAWECIGETSLNLSGYLTKTSADTLYQPIGNYVTSSIEVISANKNYVLTNDGTNVKWIELDDKDTIYSAGKYIEITNDNTINVSGLHNVTLSSTNESVGITATTGEDGTVNYNLSVEEVFIPDISGYNGISARYNEEAQRYEVGIEEDDYAFLFGHYANNQTLTDGDIIKLDSNNYHDIVIDNDGYITLPASTNKFTFCINEYIDDNTNQNHEYLLNKLVLSAKNSDSIVASQNYYPSEVGSSNVTLALTIDDTDQKEYCIVYKGSDVPANKIHIEASILEEVRSLDSSRGDVDDYTGREPIRVIQNSRVVELLYDEDVFTLKQDASLGANKLSIVAAGGEVVNKDVFDKLLNSINGRMTETIPFGALNQVASLAGYKQYSYLFRPTIEYDMTQDTVAYMFGGNHDGGERVAVAVYDSTKTSNNLIWRSDYPELNVGSGGEHTMQAHSNSPSGTIYPDHLYYVSVRIDKAGGGGSWNNVLGVPITNTTDVGNLRVWLGYGFTGGDNLDFPDSINFNTQGSLGNFGGLKPYVGFRTNIPND